jgi:hypothetical protein
MRQLADERQLPESVVKRASVAAQGLLEEWFVSGWLHKITKE